MKPEIIKFYADTGKHVDKQVKNRDEDIAPEQIKAACVEYYDTIASSDFDTRMLTLKNGTKRKFLSIAWDVGAIARKNKSVEYTKDEEVLSEINNIFAEKDKEIHRLKKLIRRYDKAIAKKNKAIRRMKLSACIFIAIGVWAVAAYRIYLAYW